MAGKLATGTGGETEPACAATAMESGASTGSMPAAGMRRPADCVMTSVLLTGTAPVRLKESWLMPSQRACPRHTSPGGFEVTGRVRAPATLSNPGRIRVSRSEEARGIPERMRALRTAALPATGGSKESEEKMRTPTGGVESIVRNTPSSKDVEYLRFD